MSITKNCIVRYCERIVTKDYCSMHKRRIQRTGTPYNLSREPRPAIIYGGIAKIPLGVNAKDGYAIVDREFAWLDKYKWNFSKRGYPVTSVGYKKINLHDMVLPNKPKGLVCDHKDRDTRNNRRSNLRHIKHLDNIINASPTSGSSIYKGVCWDKRKCKWIATITINRKSIYLGQYIDEQAAAKQYDKYAERQWGKYAYLNFPT